MDGDPTDRKRKRRIITIILWLAVFIYAFYLGYDHSTGNAGFSPQQPIEFSHKVHSGDFGMKCLYCHQSADKSSYSQIPAVHHCMICHIALKEQSELIEPLNISYFDEIPIQWVNIYRLPDYSHFDHSVHINASIDCSSCHGEVETMDSVYQEKELTMQWCLDCHREPQDFVVPARDISGIYKTYAESLIFNINSRSIVTPAYGYYISDIPKQPFNWFVFPKKPGRGPENCSACHY